MTSRRQLEAEWTRAHSLPAHFLREFQSNGKTFYGASSGPLSRFVWAMIGGQEEDVSSLSQYNLAITCTIREAVSLCRQTCICPLLLDSACSHSRTDFCVFSSVFLASLTV